MASSMEGLKSLMNELYLSEKYSDLKIHCKGSVFPVHRAIVCTQSAVLEGKTIVHRNRPKKYVTSYRIDLDEEQPVIVAALTKYLYTHDYDDHGQVADDDDSWPATATVQSVASSVDNSDTPASNVDSSSSAASMTESVSDLGQQDSSKEEIHPILFNMFVYVLAKKHRVKGLEDLSAKKYKTAIEREWDAGNFTESLEVFYTFLVEPAEMDSDEGSLKETALLAARGHIDELLEDEEFELLLRRDGDIALAILKSVVVGNKERLSQPSNEPTSDEADHIAIPDPPPSPPEELAEEAVLAEPFVEEAVAAAEPDDVPQYDAWSNWGTSKKDKKKKKNDIIEHAIEKPVEECVPEPAAAVENDDFSWGFTSKKEKKKSKKGTAVLYEVPDPAPPADPEPADDWGMFATKKHKKSKQPNVFSFQEGCCE